MMKRLPIGQQDFRKIIEGNYLYVDKTKYIHRLISTGSYYFFSRPRRFGKSLFISTLKEIFQGKKELFKDLYIYDKIEWKEHPVIHISFNDIDVKKLGLEKAIDNELNIIAKKYGLSLSTDSIALKFKQLIHTLSEKNNVVVLIDEYDKPIIDNLDNIPKAQEYREILKNFYSIVKGCDSNLEFFIMTGVSKFSHVSIFSDLNHLNDITLNKDYAQMMGISQLELEENMMEYFTEAKKELGEYFPNLMQSIKNEYLGYSWDGKNFLYNPFTILSFFYEKQFGQYWFKSGTPTFLMKLIKDQEYTFFDLEKKSVFLSAFDKFEIEEISILSLLFQTGYLTIKKHDIVRQMITLDYPNREVEHAFSVHLLAAFNGNKVGTTNSLLAEMTLSLEADKIEAFIKLFNSFIKGISYIVADRKESYFQSIFYTIVKLLGFNIECEILTIDGRIDAVLKTKEFVYVIEFKTGIGSQKAIEQIRLKNYHEKYTGDKRPKKLLCIDFDVENKCVTEWVLEDA